MGGEVMLRKASGQEVFVSSFVFLWIFIVNIVAPMVTSAPTWPMYFVTIFFFTMDADVKKISSIFLSGAMGILLAWILLKAIIIMGPVTGETAAVAVLLFIILGLVIVGGNYCPAVFNNITFAYLTIATINIELVEDYAIPWVLMLLIEGGIILTGARGSIAIAEKFLARPHGERAKEV
ncbi:hypothetical protein CBFG_02878 [Clostridiales bacterium 1_7_47FAA]|nr:hypothetical protein CBFG_02878 [Clostridiales bacterium 1_7_47FAA]